MKSFGLLVAVLLVSTGFTQTNGWQQASPQESGLDPTRLDSMQKAIDAGSRSVEVRTRLAKLRLRDGKLASAIQLYNEAIETDPYYTPAYLGLAYLYAVAEDRQEAIETLQRILKYDPGNETARTAMTDAKVDAKE